MHSHVLCSRIIKISKNTYQVAKMKDLQIFRSLFRISNNYYFSQINIIIWTFLVIPSIFK